MAARWVPQRTDRCEDGTYHVDLYATKVQWSTTPQLLARSLIQRLLVKEAVKHVVRRLGLKR